jgi:hypothetical protein
VQFTRILGPRRQIQRVVASPKSLLADAVGLGCVACALRTPEQVVLARPEFKQLQQELKASLKWLQRARAVLARADSLTLEARPLSQRRTCALPCPIGRALPYVFNLYIN